MAESRITIQPSAPRQALLFELDDSLASPLSSVLAECHWQAVPAPAGSKCPPARIVFCSPDREVLARALRSFAKLPVVVVSRLPEIEGWLDALEAGAADYCAAPFEASQLRWLLETHAGKSRMAA